MGMELKDESGRVVGHYLTPDEYRALQDAAKYGTFSEEIHQRNLKLIESGDAVRLGKSTEEVMEILHKLDAILPARA